jgi:predicted permease
VILSNLLTDAAHAWQGLRVSPGFSLAAILTLALGVGANTAIFSVAHALLVRPLPFHDPSRLVFVWADQASEGYPRAPLSGPELLDLDQRNSRFEGFGAIWATTAALTGGSEPEQLRVGFVSTDFFSVLGAEAALGRTFEPSDEATGPPVAVLLSGALWQRRFGSDPDIVGRRIEVNGQPLTVAGVMPIGFRLMMPPDAAVPDDLEAWVPFNRRFTEGPRGQRYLRVVGRLRPGVTVDEGRDDIARVGREISQANAFYGAAGRRFETVALHVDATRDVRTPLVVLSVGAGILLLMACVNVASLLVARAAGRARETAMKAALGAGIGRIARQHLLESLMLGVAGGIAGLLLGRWGLSLLLAATPEALGRLRLAEVNATVAAVSLGTVLTWTMLLAVAPLSEALRLNLVESLRTDGQRAGGRPGVRLRRALTVAQLALSVVLVVAALLLVRTVERVQNADVGFRVDHALTFRIAPPQSRYQSQEAFNAFSRQLQAALGALPGVTAASAISHVPYDHVPNWGGPYLANQGDDPSAAPQADYRAVAPGMMELLGVRLLEGRTFTESDDTNGAPVAIVDERLAARTWPGESPIGRRLGVDPFVVGSPSTWVTVVGLVRHVRHRTPTEDVREQVYFPQRQVTRNPFVMVVKTASDPAGLSAAVRASVTRLDAALPIYDVRPLGVYIERAQAIRRFTALLAAVFAIAALLLASVGVYGVIAYSVSTRRREFGVRLALGARASQIVSAVVRESTMLTASGLLLGLAAAVAGAWGVRSQLFEVAPWDLLTLSVTALILGVVASVASVVPARRALGTDPADVLRAD